MPFVKSMAAAVVGLIVAFAALVVSSAGAAVAAEGLSVLRRGVSNDPESIDPFYVQGNSGATLAYDMFEGLLTIDAAGNIIPGLAKSWTVDEAGVVYTLTLRDGALWSDGTPITSDDVVFSFQRNANPANATRGARAIMAIKNAAPILASKMPVEALGVRAVSDRVVEIELTHPAPYFPDLLVSFSNSVLPRHTIEKYGKEWTRPENIVVSGAYTLVEWVTNTDIHVRKNPRYYDAANVHIDEIYFYPVEKPAASFNRFRAGELDIIRLIPIDQIDEIEKDYADELRREPDAGVFYLLVNNAVEPLDNKSVREALSISIDRDFIAGTLIRDASGPAYTIVPLSLPGYAQELPSYATQSMDERRAEAKSLLAAAGYGDQKPLTVTLKFGGQEKNRRTAVAVQAMWKGIGVDAQLENIGSRSVVSDAREGSFQIIRYNYFAPFLDPVAFLNLLKTDGNTNYSKYSNPDFDEALTNLDAIRDPPARMAEMQRIERLAMADFPVIPVYFEGRVSLVKSRVKGWVDNGRGDHLGRYLSLDDGQ